MKSRIVRLLLALTAFTVLYACGKSFLTVKPVGAIDQGSLTNQIGLNKVLLGAYAMLDGEDGTSNIGNQWGSGASNFVFGSMAGGEANRGSSPGDQGPNMSPAIRHQAAPTDQAYNDRWIALYEGIKRSNTVLELLAQTTGLSDSISKNITGQARLLRAWYHFQARITFGKVPFIDEKADIDLASKKITSVANNTDIFPQILADAKYAYQNLAGLQDAKGRINKWCAGAVYGKILMFTKDFATALTVLTDVVANGTTPFPLGVHYGLNPNYSDNFNIDTENGVESVFAFQSSSQDNAGARNANWGDNLNESPKLGGAGFFCPTYYFTNQFKTDAAGLPLANPEDMVVMDPAGQAGLTQYAGNVDTRLDWTVGRNGVPFLDWGTYATNWGRDVSDGPFAGKKIMIRQAQAGSFHDASVWFSSGGTALNINLLRFSDVMLLLAEAETEVGSLANAFALVNQIRTRAQNTLTVAFPAIYGVPKTMPYAVPFATQDQARTAIRLERLLELGMEGHRFFDLIRWGTAATELNTFYGYESAFAYQLNGDLNPKPTYTPGPAADYYSIPQQQIDLSHGMLTP